MYWPIIAFKNYTPISISLSYSKKAEVGVAIIADGKDTVTVENNRRYPLMSVFKLHQALAVGDYCKKASNFL